LFCLVFFLVYEGFLLGGQNSVEQEDGNLRKARHYGAMRCRFAVTVLARGVGSTRKE
jgi:hypothetical protein